MQVQSEYKLLPCAFSEILFIIDLFSGINIPMRKMLTQRIKPLGHSCFATINFLASADQAYHYRPILMPVHSANQKSRLTETQIAFGGSSGAYFIVFSHERCHFIVCPCSLRFVKNRNFLCRNNIVSKMIIPVMVNHLNEATDSSFGFSFRYCDSFFCFKSNLITR